MPLGHIQMLGKTDAAMFQGEAHHLLPGFAAGKLASHALDFWLTSEDLPDPDNRVLVDRDGGIRLHYRPNNLEPHQMLTRKLRHLLNHIGCEPHLLPQNAYFGKSLPIAGTGHQNGTIRFGHDPHIVGARHELPGARGRQSLCRRRQLFPVERGGKPDADDHRQRAAGRRPSARARSAPGVPADDPHPHSRLYLRAAARRAAGLGRAGGRCGRAMS